MGEFVIGTIFLVGGWIGCLKIQAWFWRSRWGHIQWLETLVVFGLLVLPCVLIRVVFHSWMGLVLLSPLECGVFVSILVSALDQFHPFLGSPARLGGTLLFIFVASILLGAGAGSLAHSWFVGAVIGAVAILPVGASVLWISEQRYIREIAKKQT